MDIEKFNSISIIILAGGKSSRIGLNRDKGKMKLLGVNLIDKVISNILSVDMFSEKDILIVGPKKRFPKYERVVEDIYPQKGPLGGIFTGLYHSKSFYNLVIGYDMPFIEPKLIRFMVKKIDNYDAVIPTHSQGLYEPLCAIYSKKCLEIMKRNIKDEKLSVKCIFPFLKIRLIDEKEIKKCDPDLHSFFNINFKGDFARAKKLTQRRSKNNC